MQSAALAPSAALPAAPSQGRYRFAGTGTDYFVLNLTNFLLTVVTFGFASFLGYTRWRSNRWLVENVTFDSQPFRYNASWGDDLGQSILSSLLLFGTCSLATPWVIAWNARVRARHTTTADGRQLEFDGTGMDVVGLLLLSVALYFISLGMAWPVIAILWRRWKMSKTAVLDPRVPGGRYYLRLDAGPWSYLISGMLSAVLVQVTLGLYLSTALLNFERFAWASTTDDLSPPLVIPSGPRTAAQWGVLIATGVGAVGLAAALVLLVAVGAGLSHSVRSSPAADDSRDREDAPIRTAHAQATATAPRAAGPATPPEATGTPAPGGGAAPVSRPEGFPEQIPPERTPAPKVSEWSAAPIVKLDPDGCSRKVVREWMKLNCSHNDDNTVNPVAISGVSGMGGFGADYFTWEKSGKVIDLVVRMRSGGRGTATFELDSGPVTAGYDWTAGATWPIVIWQ